MTFDSLQSRKVVICKRIIEVMAKLPNCLPEVHNSSSNCDRARDWKSAGIAIFTGRNKSCYLAVTHCAEMISRKPLFNSCATPCLCTYCQARYKFVKLTNFHSSEWEMLKASGWVSGAQFALLGNCQYKGLRDVQSRVRGRQYIVLVAPVQRSVVALVGAGQS